MKHVAVYVTGSIAAYKAVELVRLLQKKGFAVRVAETSAATKLVGPATFSALTKHEVLCDLWSESGHGRIPHIELADWSDLAVIVPATANVIAKLAHGVADDAVSTSLLATSAPVIIVPAMNVHMWENPATQRNLTVLKADGRLIMEPEEGYLAEGYSGKGRLPSVASIAEFVCQAANNLTGDLMGRKFAITLGGTCEPIDPVRFLGNRSTGKMGLAIAKAVVKRGAEVTIIAGNIQVSLPSDPQVNIIHAPTTEAMADAVQAAMVDADVLVMAAAVADFRVVKPAQRKMKKTTGKSSYQLTLVPTVDILKRAGEQKKPGQLVVGFAAETDDLLNNAQQKLINKHADLIVANDVGNAQIGFGSNNNQVTILRPNHQAETWPLMSKQMVGDRLASLIASLLRRNG